MKEVIRNVLGYQVPTLFYESVEEADKAAGRVGAVLDECNANLAYRGSNADARDLIFSVAEELTGVAPLLEDSGKKSADGKPVMVISESEEEYVTRALAQNKKGITKEAVQKLVTERARGYTAKDGTKVPAIAVDIKQRERKPAQPKKLPAKFKDTALGIIKAKKVNAFLDKEVKPILPNAAFKATGDQDKDAETLGWLIKEFITAREAAALASFTK